VVAHLVGLDQVLGAMLAGEPAPARRALPPNELAPALRESGQQLRTAFARPGVLEGEFDGPLGAATGADRLQIRLYDLLAHGWDLGRALGREPAFEPEVVQRSLAFAHRQLAGQDRGRRFAAPQPVPADAPPLLRLVAFLGRAPEWTPSGR